MNDSSQFRLVKIETEIRIRASRENVFRAFTDDYDEWWPHRYKPDSKCTVDARPGGYIFEHFASGGGAVTGTIVYIDSPSKMIGSGPSSLLRGFESFSSMSFEEDGEDTILKRSMELWGDVTEEDEKMFREGTRLLMELALKGYLEEGKKYEVRS